MLSVDRLRFALVIALAAVVRTGCRSSEAADSAAGEGAAAAEEDIPFRQLPSGNTGTPGDQVKDMVLDDRGLVVLPNPRPVMITDWQRLPPGRVWGAGPAGGFGPDGQYWQLD